ncbi:DNA repair protein rad9 [Mizugakiibacter sediminis]|uniref:DNA repair protein rad9 n=1 Tax=Mizugakiibacter sediminis TaxID=1475481 RepID=A0A0K8QR42_9GAMM|nr:DNA repair protein rad9 [Mizugakiibacter sediminis]
MVFPAFSIVGARAPASAGRIAGAISPTSGMRPAAPCDAVHAPRETREARQGRASRGRPSDGRSGARDLVPEKGFEPPTYALRMRRSTS